MTPTNSVGSLAVTTPSEREIAMVRALDALARLVFDAHTRPDLVRRWLLGPDGWTMSVCEIDLRVGGGFRYAWRNADGRDFGIDGFDREIAAPGRSVHTEVCEGAECLVTTIFEEEAGRTTVTMTMLFASREARDGALGSGMARGVAASYDRLVGMLAST